MLFLASRRGGRLDVGRLVMVRLRCSRLLGHLRRARAGAVSDALEAVTSGNDPSFFYRVRGPALAAFDTFARYPLAGAGLAGEPVIEKEITNVYLRSPFYSANWQIVSPATELVINYFWEQLDLSRAESVGICRSESRT